MKLAKKVYWTLLQFGFDPIKFVTAVKGIPPFFLDFIKFRKRYHGRLNWMPCLTDRFDEGGNLHNEYFWQDLTVARRIWETNPIKHVDIGSRIDGFVAHVASFRELEVIDIRPLSRDIPGVRFKKADVMELGEEFDLPHGYCDSLSCLHTVEHFGLGRYGDQIDPIGHEIGLRNMVQLLKPGGRFYLSTPIGKNRIEFNANRVFDPLAIMRLAESNDLLFEKLLVIEKGAEIKHVERVKIPELSEQDYALGIFEFTKLARNNLR